MEQTTGETQPSGPSDVVATGSPSTSGTLVKSRDPCSSPYH